MSRGLSPALVSAAQAREVNLAFFGYFDFSAGPVRVWSGLGDFAWDGHTWAGVGALAEIGNAQESGAASATTMTVGLSGITTAMVSAILTGQNRGRFAQVWWALFTTPELTTLVDDPQSWWLGRMGAIEWEDDGAAAQIRIPIEGLYVDVKTPQIRRWSYGDQIARHPGDTGMRYLAAIANRVLYFGTQAPH
jgi:hypothetical protein